MTLNLVWGVKNGAFMAAAYSIAALVIYAVLGNHAIHTPGLTIGLVLESYWVGGLTAGLLVGILRPLSKLRWGPYLLGAIAGITVFAAFQASTMGPMWRWSWGDWIEPCILGTIMGVVVASDPRARESI
jgi:hypothetical protein